MRFIQFLTEAPQQGDFIKKNEKADRQRARRATAKRAAANKQNMQANVQQSAVGAGQPQAQPQQRNSDTIQPPPGNFQKKEAPKAAAPIAPVDPNLKPFLDIAGGDRAKAMEMITLLGAIYQTKRTNPQVELTVPKLVSQSQNREALQKLFDIAKGKELPQLAAMSQEIKRSAAMPGQQGAAPSGMLTAPSTPGQTPAGKTMLQSLLDKIKQATKSLSPMDFSAVRKAIDKASQSAKPHPSTNTQQPMNKPVVTQG